MKATATKPTIDGNAVPNLISHHSRGPDGALDDVGSLANRREDSAALMLDALGIIRYCDRGSEALFKYRWDELLGQHVSMLLPQLVDLQLIEDGQANQRLRFLCRVGQHFQGLAKDGERFNSELFFSVLHSAESDRLSLIVRRAGEAADGGALKMPAATAAGTQVL